METCLESHHKETYYTVIRSLLRESLCDNLLIKFTLKIQDAPLFLCLPLTGRSDKKNPFTTAKSCTPPNEQPFE